MNWYEMISDTYGETKTNCILWKESTEVYLLYSIFHVRKKEYMKLFMHPLIRAKDMQEW